MPLLISLLSGLLFGLGLAISEMMNPAKVLNFLDVAGQWDPSLMLVMGGALAITIPGFRWVLRREAPLFDGRFQLPTRRDIDARLLGGAALFGLGWGLAGFCPGPAVAALGSGSLTIGGFVLMMLVGYRLADWVEARGNP